MSVARAAPRVLKRATGSKRERGALVTRESSRATSHQFFPVLASAACACPRACRTKGRTDQGYLQLVLRPLALRFIRSAERRGTQVGSANWLHRIRGASGHALLPPAP